MNKHEAEKGFDPKKSANAIEKQVAQFKRSNPNVEEALRLFNISKEHYDASVSAYSNTKTYVTTSTLLPAKNV